MINVDDEYSVNINSTLKWQGVTVVCAQLLVLVVGEYDSGILAGGVLVMLSTWHVYRSVMVAQGEKGQLMQAAGLRFVLLLICLSLFLLLFELEAVLVLIGMAVAYVALYAHGLMVIYRRMKGS
ncbi:MAG: hypothetical protein R8M45_10490 [Ghiorsea sp.]